MTLGEKLKQARLEAGLSQRQLCGDTITRNMLSQIENGSARPSMDTLRAFAQRLGKPISWFLEEDTVTSPNRQIMENARQSFASGDAAGVLLALADYREPDDTFDPEANLLRHLSLVSQGCQALEAGKDVYARSLLEAAGAAGEKTPYFTEALRRSWVLAMAQAEPERLQHWVAQLPRDHRELYLRAEAAADPLEAARYLQAAREDTPQWHKAMGAVALAQQDYKAAATHFHRVEADHPEVEQQLEICYRELGDYKMAYYYACRRHKEQ